MLSASPFLGPPQREDHNLARLPQVDLDEVVPRERVDELRAAVHEDVFVALLLQLRDLRPRSPESTVEFDHSGFWSVEETTYFGIELNLSANSPAREGQAAAKPS